MSDKVSFHISADPPPRLDKAIARDVPEAAHISRSRLAKLLSDGAVSVNGAAPGNRVIEGDLVEIMVPEAEPVDMVAEDIPLVIVHEDDDLVVVDKPAGMVVHPAPGTPRGTLVNALLHHFGGALSGVGGMARPGIVHRIDKDTSGLLVVAKSDAAHHGLAAQFEAHSVERLYRAVCFGVPDPGDPRVRGLRGVSWVDGRMKVTTRLARHPSERQKQAVYWDSGRHAVTFVKTVATMGSAALIECQLETGRTHQIRVHMAYLGHGLLGDPTYGGKRKMPRGQPGLDEAQGFARQALHAATLGFEHPVTSEQMRFASPLPDDIAGLLVALGLTKS